MDIIVAFYFHYINFRSKNKQLQNQQKLTAMHKVRKNSLSPCYATANKQNLPIENLTSPVGISFKNLEQARKKKTIQTQQQSVYPKMSLNQYFLKQTNGQDQSHYQSTTRHPKQNRVGQSARRQNDRSIDDYRSSLKSKQKQMSSLHSQVATLNSTIGLLKEQLGSLKQQNSTILSENSQYKRIINQKNQQLEKLRKERSEISQNLTPRQIPSRSPSVKNQASTTQQCQKCKNKTSKKQNDSEYEQVIEKLNQLQMVQNKLLQQNESLKKKEVMNQAMFKNFKVLLDAGRVQQIRDLVNLLNQ